MSTSSAELRRIAARYSAALFSLASEKSQLDEVQKDLQAVADAAKEGGTFVRLLTSPITSREGQENAINAVLTGIKASKLTHEFFRVLIENRRLDIAPFVAEYFTRAVMDSRNETIATVTTAYPLSEKQVGALKTSLKKATGRDDVQVVLKENPEILGGVVVHVDGKMFDNSVAGKINRLSASLKAGVAN